MKFVVRLHNTPTRYGPAAQAMHWVVFALVGVQYFLGIQGHSLPVSLERLIVLSRHKSIGMTIFVLMLARIAWRLYSAPPRLPPMSRLLQRLAGASHVMLYAMLVLTALLGWLLASASNLSVSWFGLIELPDLVRPDKRLTHWLLIAHQGAAWLLLALILVHAGAAVWHHFYRKDDVMRRMLPDIGRSRI